MFRNDKRQFYKALGGQMNGQTEATDPKFWSKLCCKPVNRDSEWLMKKVKEKLRDTPKQENVCSIAAKGN